MYKIILVVFFTTSLMHGAEKRFIDFSRPAAPGLTLSCFVNASSRTESITEFAEINTTPAVSKLEKSVQTKGLVKIIEVNAKGISTKIEFIPEKFHGKINGQEIHPRWVGKTLKINLNTKNVCEFSILNSKRTISKAEIQLLDLIFKPTPQYTLSDVVNPPNAISDIDSWTPNFLPFREIFKNQGIETDAPLAFKGNVNLLGKKDFHNHKCWNLEEIVSMNNIKGMDFNFFMSVLIPVNKKIGSSLKTVRKIYEKIEKIPDSNSFMISGIKKISLQMTEAISITSLPIDAKYKN